jgi:hypothetical protein
MPTFMRTQTADLIILWALPASQIDSLDFTALTAAFN